jgi:hypothetical protein
MGVKMRTTRRIVFVVAPLLAIAALAASCQIVGQGHLNVSNDLSGIGADNTEFRAFAAGQGDAWPPQGKLALAVRGDDFGSPPAYGMNGYLYLVRTNKVCPESEGTPEMFELADVTIEGIVTVTDGTVNQFLTMDDTTANRQSTWALIDIPELAGWEPGHRIHRCGTVTWAP